MKRYVLGIDNGGTAVKAVLFDVLGTEIASAKQNLPIMNPNNGFTERDMNLLWTMNCEVIQKTIASAKIDPASIAGVSFSGHGKGLYLWGKTNKPVRPGIISTDSRAYGIVERWKKDKTEERAFPFTCQSILASQPVALIRWFMENEPEVIDETRWIFGVKDYIRYRMTGEAYGEITDLSGSNLVNLHTGKYDMNVLKMFGIEAVWDKLPPLIQSSQFCGKVNAECSKETGLYEGTPVAGGLFDIDACAIGMNIVDSSCLAIIAGTWSINEYISKKPIMDQSVKMNSLYCLPGYYLVEECSPTSASNQEWFINRFLTEAAGNEAKSLYDFANETAGAVLPGEQSIVFLPYLFGGTDDAHARAAFIGLDSSNTRGDMLRSIYEGVVFGHKKHVERLLKSRLTPPRAVRLAGGVGNSPLWVQMFADILEIQIETVAAKEIGTLGAAMTAAVAVGEYRDLEEAAGSMVKINRIYSCNDKNKAVYRRKYMRFCTVDDALSSIWNK